MPMDAKARLKLKTPSPRYNFPFPVLQAEITASFVDGLLS